jgi:hypothetical protein
MSDSPGDFDGKFDEWKSRMKGLQNGHAQRSGPLVAAMMAVNYRTSNATPATPNAPATRSTLQPTVVRL